MSSGKAALVDAQRSDPELGDLFDKALTSQEIDAVPVGYFVCLFMLNMSYMSGGWEAQSEN